MRGIKLLNLLSLARQSECIIHTIVFQVLVELTRESIPAGNISNSNCKNVEPHGLARSVDCPIGKVMKPITVFGRIL